MKIRFILNWNGYAAQEIEVFETAEAQRLIDLGYAIEEFETVNVTVNQNIAGVTGETVDNTDPKNPIVGLQNAAQTDVLDANGNYVSENVEGVLSETADILSTVQTALSDDNATQEELNAAFATIQTSLGDKVPQSVYDAMLAGNSTDAERQALETALNAEIDALEASQIAQDALIAALSSPAQQTTEETLIFRHHVGNAGVFTSLTETETVNATSTDPANEDKFSLLSDLENYRSSDGLFRFRLRYVDLNKEIEWTQSNNPVADKANGQNQDIAQNVTVISSTDAAVLGTDISAFGGFNNNTISPNTYYDLNPGSTWWYPIGQRVLFGGGMPAYNAGTSIINNGAMEIYVTKVTGGEITQIVDTSEPKNLIREGVNGAALLIEDDLSTSASVANYSKKEIWLKIGQSNSVGTDGSGPIDHNGLDAVHPKVFEYSRGINKAEYRAAPAGELMAYRNPAQDDGSGIGFGQLFGKTRVELNPEIEQLIIINRGVGGTGFAGNRWNVGNDLYTLAVNDLKQALTDNPDAVFKGIVWHQGESDAGQGQAFYEAALAAMVEGIRTEAQNVAPGRVEGVFICGTMVESWIAANETDRRPIDLAHRNVANYITGSTFADFSDLIENQDAIHFGTNDLREMGKRYAENVQGLFSEILPSYRIKVQNDEIVDLFDGGGKVFDITTTTDSERGEVLDSNSRGFQTSMVLNNEQYTKSGWLNLQSTVAGFGNFISGLIDGGTLAEGHYWGWPSSGQAGSATGANSTGLSGNVTLNNWVHATLTSDGTNHELFINGVSEAVVAVNNVLSPPQLVELGTIGGNGNNTLDALLDDIVILPYALNADGAQKLYELVLDPVLATTEVIGLQTTPLDASTALVEATGSGSSFIYEVGTASPIELTAPNSTVGGVATYRASNHGAGAKILVSDSAAGEWDVSVVGAPSNTSGYNLVTTASTDIIGVSGTTFLYDNTNPASGQVAINGSAYYDEGAYRYVTVDLVISTDPDCIYEIGSNIMPVGGEIVSAHISGQALGQTGRYATVGVVGGQTNQFFTNRLDAIDNTDMAISVWLKVSNPAGEGTVILAGMATTEEKQLDTYQMPYNSATDAGYINSQSPFPYNPVAIVIANSGKYSIEVHPFQSTTNLESGTRTGGLFELKDDVGVTVSSIDFLNVNIDALYTNYPYTGGSQTVVVNLTKGNYTLNFTGSSGDGNGNRTSGNGYVDFKVKFEGVKTLVMPEALEVGDTVLLKATKTATQSLPIATDTQLTGWVANQDTAAGFTNDSYVATKDVEFGLNAHVRLDAPNGAAVNGESFIIVLVDGNQVMRGGISRSGWISIDGDDFFYGSVSGDLTLKKGQVVTIEVRHGFAQAVNVNPDPSITYWHMSQKSSQEVLNTTDTPTNMTQVGTPLSGISTREYTLQWNGSEIVNVLSFEYGSNSLGSFECNHITGVLRQWGSVNINGAVNISMPVSFASSNDYEVVGTLKGTQAATNRTHGCIPVTASAFNAHFKNANNNTVTNGDMAWQAIGIKP